ncbi:MAG TPA: PspC domain-containing protein [Caldilineaceae bacterium]|nr:PspC domain-containing protein [Caldilineaceae bacterium]
MEKLAESATPATANQTNESGASRMGQAGPTQAETATEQPVSPQPTTTGRRMLFRHPVHRILGGVCGGLADLMDWAPALVRILWVVATLATGGGGILAYVALWILLPVGTAEGGQQRPPALELNERNLGRAAFLLIGLGILWLLANIGILPWLWSSFWRVVGIVFWPALLIGAGYLLLRYTGRGEWSFNWQSARDRAKGELNGRMPTKDQMKAGLRRARASFPLKRSRTDRIFMGVCGGIGQRLGIDANLVRLIWAAFSVGSIGMGVLIYVLAGLLLPEEPVTALNQYTNGEQDVQVIDVRATHV